MRAILRYYFVDRTIELPATISLGLHAFSGLNGDMQTQMHAVYATSKKRALDQYGAYQGRHAPCCTLFACG